MIIISFEVICINREQVFRIDSSSSQISVSQSKIETGKKKT